MMWFMIGPGLVALIFGVIFLIAPKRLMQEKTPPVRPLINTDALFLEHRICTGICLISVGVFCLLSAFYVWLRLNS